MSEPFAAVDEEDIAGDVIGSHEIEHRFRNIFRRTPTVQKCLIGSAGDAFGRVVGWGQHRARGHGVDSDGRGKFQSELPCKRHNRRLADAVSDEIRPGLESGEIGDVDDSTFTLGQHARRYGIGAVVGAIDANPRHSMPAIMVVGGEGRLPIQGSAVDEDIDATEVARRPA